MLWYVWRDTREKRPQYLLKIKVNELPLMYPLLVQSLAGSDVTIFDGNKVSSGRKGPAIFVANDLYNNIILKFGR